ncbi:MAG: hypothetical protein OXG97_03085 [Candidatus Poribacteria bacterium]|nr:hypothetical protein [Candidatus Poribacteria bacterium]
MSSNVFCAELDRMARDVRETYEPMPGTDKALLPGAIEIERPSLNVMKARFR